MPHPLIRNFYVEWMEELDQNVKIVLEKVLELGIELLDFSVYMQKAVLRQRIDNQRIDNFFSLLDMLLDGSDQVIL